MSMMLNQKRQRQLFMRIALETGGDVREKD